MERINFKDYIVTTLNDVVVSAASYKEAIRKMVSL